MRRLASRTTAAGLALSLFAVSAVAQVGDLRNPETYETWALVPDDAEHEVPVESSVRLHLRRLSCIRWADDLESCLLKKPDTRGLSIAWTVNGVLGGGPDIGRVRTFQDRFNTGGAVSTGLDIDDVLYIAPDKVPSPNPVAVAAVIGNMDSKEQVQLVTHVRVVDTPGWRGSFRVHLTAIFDPYGGLPTRTAAENPVFWVPELSVFDGDNDIDLTAIESELVYTVTGVVSESYDDHGVGIVILETRPNGSFNYFHRTNGRCDHGLTIASGERDEAYLSTPLYITMMVLPNGRTVIKAIPNVAFDVKGRHWFEDCNDGFNEPYENFFYGELINGEEILEAETADPQEPMYGYNPRLVGLPGDGRSYYGDARLPLNVHFGGADVPAEAEVSWSLSRKP